MKLVIINSYPINDCPGNELLDLLCFVLDFSEGKLYSSEFTFFLLCCIACRLRPLSLTVTTSKVRKSKVQVIIVELTEAPNQVWKSLRLLALEATEGKPRT